MKNQKENVQPIEIVQIANGYAVHIGNATGCIKESYVFQSFTELVNFLNGHLTYRNDNIYTDYNEQVSITLR